MNAQSLLDSLCVVLCRTSHPGNIGAAARAIKTMGISRLRLVAPRYWPHPEATALAANATDVLDTATRYESLTAALADCQLAYGMSARSRDLGPPLLTARDACRQLIDTLKTQLSEQQATTANCALVFGNETSGLSNAELQRCQILVSIPAAATASSLNLAQAVQVIAYECRYAAYSDDPPATGFATASLSEQATLVEIEALIAHFEEVMFASGFYDRQKPKRLLAKLQRLILRSQPQHDEVQLLRGLLAAIRTHLPHEA